MREESLSVRRKIYRKICALGERFLPDKLYLEMLYQVRMGEKLDLKNRYTIIIVTHNMQQATRISDKTAFFLHGEIVEFDETQRIFSNPKEQKTLEYITGRFG